MALPSMKKLVKLIFVTLAVLLLTMLVGWGSPHFMASLNEDEISYILFYAESVWIAGLFVAVLHEFHGLHKKKKYMSSHSTVLIFCSFLAFLWIESAFFPRTIPGTAFTG